MAADIADRVVGSVLGLALGDALGAPFEFSRRDDIPDPLVPFERPWMGLPPGTTTDDTAMALNLVRSLAYHGSLVPHDLLARHVEWLNSDPQDVGALTRRVLRRVQAGEDPEAAAQAVWEERGPEVSAGNGSVMYCAPLGVAYANRPITLLGVAPWLSALTHYDERCRTAVVAVTLTAASLVRGDDPETAVRKSVEVTLDRPGGEELEFLVDAVGSERAVDGPDQGFCLYTAAIGLQAVARSLDVEEELLHVVRLGGDTDTNAAVAGALLGAAAGASGLPSGWLEHLQASARIRADAESLVVLAQMT
ncbi:MAG: ADP-ribosylglycohydrolase family protein [Actinomycetota bacterium]